MTEEEIENVSNSISTLASEKSQALRIKFYEMLKEKNNTNLIHIFQKPDISFLNL